LSADIATWKQNGFDGDNPFEKQSTPSFGELADDYIDRHIKAHASRPDKAAGITKWMIDKYIASWRNQRVTAIRKRDVLDLHARIGTEHGKHVANRVVQLLRAVLYWGAESGMRGLQGPNPATGVKLFHEAKRRRFLQPDELPRFFAALKKKETSADLRDFVNLAMWTGARRNDILSMRWQDVSLADNAWRVPDPKNREPYSIPLTPEAIIILRGRMRRRKDQQNIWVFPSRGETGHIVDLRGCWKKLLARAHVENLRIHDLRRTLASWQAIQGTSLTIVGASLGHKSLQATSVYGQLTLDPVRKSVMTATRSIIRASKRKPKLLRAPAGGGR
jgi:integrase